jgi:hypothetical protein
LHFSKEVLDCCKFNVSFLGSKFNVTSLISLLMDMSEVILNLVPRRKKRRGGTLGSTKDQVGKLFSDILGSRVWGRST